MAISINPYKGLKYFEILNAYEGPLHTRARDQYTSSSLIGGKGDAGPSLLHTTLEGPT